MVGFLGAVLKRVLVSVLILGIFIGLSAVWRHFFGPSKVAYAGAILLVAWPWALPQVFVVVSLIWFLVQRISHKHRKRETRLDATS